MSAILALDVRENVLVDLADLVRGEHLDDHVAFASLRAHSQRDNVSGFDFTRVDMRLHLDRLIRIQLVNIDLPIGLLEFLFELFSDWNDISIFNDLLGELVQELLLRHWIQSIQVCKLFKPRILSQLVVISLINHVDGLKGDTFGILLLQVIREVAV